MKLILLSLFVSLSFSIANAASENEAAIQLNCDHNVEGATCPVSKATNVSLLSNTNPVAENSSGKGSSESNK